MTGAAVWEQVQVPSVDASGWSRIQVRAALVELERIRRQCEAAEVVLLSSSGQTGRDGAAALVRATGRSAVAAREAVRAAGVVTRSAAAAGSLESGSVSAAHVAAVSQVEREADVEALLKIAAEQTVDEFKETVTAHRAAAIGGGTRGRQRFRRGLSFAYGPDGTVVVRAVLPTLEGNQVRRRIEAAADAAYLREHPDRAARLGGHGAAPLRQRWADALVELVCGARQGTPRPAAAVVVVMDPLRRTASVLPDQPISFEEAVDLAGCSEVYAAIRDSTDWAQLRFGRNRRLASALQRLALMVRDRHCVVPGCRASPYQAAAHHAVDFDDGGGTDLDNLALLCAEHHVFLHTNGLRLARGPDGWEVVHADGTPLDDAWPRAG